MQAVILAGGKGTRLRERLNGLPKPLADVGGKPLIQHQIELLRRHGFSNVLLLLGYGAETISRHFGDGSGFGMRIQCLTEATPLGSAGAVLAGREHLEDRVLIMYGDTMLNVDLQRFWMEHERRRPDGSLFLHPNDHPHDSDLVEIDEQSRITAFHSYPHFPGESHPNLVNAALYIIEKSALAPWPTPGHPVDLAKSLFPAMLSRGLYLHGYRSPEYIKDAGAPERLDRVIADHRSGRIERGSFATPSPAVFLDRDGTLNEEVSYVKCPEELALVSGAPQAVRRLNRAGYRAIVVTNQPVIARGECSEDTLQAIHNKLESLLGEEGAYLDRIYYCPHHPYAGFPGERSDLKMKCSCRKPGTGMIERARSELNIDLSRSWLIGDSTVDIRTARQAGIRSILVQTGHAGRDGVWPDKPDFTFPTLTEAVDCLSSVRQEGEEQHI